MGTRGSHVRRGRSLRIGVLSDTHGLLRPEVIALFQGVDHILHAGDIGGEKVLDGLREIAPVTAVAGNIDGFRCGDALEMARVELGGLRFFLTHILARPRQPRAEVLAELGRAPANVVIFGHSHLPHDEVIGGVRFFNPASAGPRRFNYPIAVGFFEKTGKVWRTFHVGLDERSTAVLEGGQFNQLSRV